MKRGLSKLIFFIIFPIIFSLILTNFLLAEENQSFSQSANATSTESITTLTTSTPTTSTTTTDQTSTTSTSTLFESTTTISTNIATTDSDTSNTTFTDSTSANITTNQTDTSTFSNPENLTEETNTEEIITEETAKEEQTESSQPESPPKESPQPFLPPLKQRKIEKEVKIDFSAPYSCKAKIFSIDISNKNQTIIELELLGTKPQNSTLEIGNLPLGIDITFLNTTNYSWNPLPNETTAVLQIINQPGSQKGNFSIVIIYTNNSTQKSSICQVNIVNL